jgi:type IV pilus assembly protein PilQ
MIWNKGRVTMQTIKSAAILLVFFMALVGSMEAQDAESSTRLKKVNLIVTEHYKDMPIREIIDKIAEDTGKTITLGKNVSGVVRDLKINGLYWTKALRAIANDIDAYYVEESPDWVKLTQPPKVTFSTDPSGTDIKEILENISLNFGFNLAMSDKVSGTVILRLKRVPWRQAVEIVAKTAGPYSVVEEDYNILRIVPTDELTQQLETRVFPLRYITAPSTVQAIMTSPYAEVGKPQTEFVLEEALKNIVTKDVGFFKFDPSTRAFIVKDTRPVLKKVEELIKKLDKPKPQVSLEVHVVSTSRNNFLDLGVDWGTTGPVISLAGGSMLHRLPFQLGSGGFEDSIGLSQANLTNGITQNGQPASEQGTLSIPNPVDFGNNTGGKAFTAGSLDFTGLKAVLKFVETDSESKVVQSPNLVVLDNVRATLFSGDEIRYAESSQVANQTGGFEIDFSEASGSPVNVGFQLFVTPHILKEEGKVILDIISKSDILSGTSSTNIAGFESFGTGLDAIDLPRITSQTMVTQVIVESGRTAMIGGLVSYTDTKTERKIPILGDLPLIGFFFKNKSRNKTVKNLTIFIRPTFTMDTEESRQAMLADLEERRERALREFRKDSPQNSKKSK